MSSSTSKKVTTQSPKSHHSTNQPTCLCDIASCKLFFVSYHYCKFLLFVLSDHKSLIHQPISQSIAWPIGQSIKPILGHCRITSFKPFSTFFLQLLLIPENEWSINPLDQSTHLINQPTKSIRQPEHYFTHYYSPFSFVQSLSKNIHYICSEVYRSIYVDVCVLLGYFWCSLQATMPPTWSGRVLPNSQPPHANHIAFVISPPPPHRHRLA